LRTIRALRPLCYSFFFVTLGVPVALLGALLGRGTAPVVGMFAVTALARVVLHLSARRPGSAPFQFAVLPLRDVLSLSLWAWSFVTRRVHWREDRYRVTRDGSVQPVVRI
jgi:ceramide glucosyltransferase